MIGPKPSKPLSSSRCGPRVRVARCSPQDDCSDGGVVEDEATLVQVALIWLAHMGIDRAAGFGFKYGDADFQDTHIGRTAYRLKTGLIARPG